MTTLHQRLIDAELGGKINEDGAGEYVPDEAATSTVVAVVAEWLRYNAAILRVPPWVGMDHVAEYADQYERMADAILDGRM